MQVLDFAAFEKAVSPERLSTYARSNVAASKADMVGLYLWNTALCAALYPALDCLEVALRNSMHNAISAKFHNELWFAAQPPILKPRELATVAKPIATL